MIFSFFESVDEILKFESLSLTTQMKATEQYFPVALLFMLYKMVLSSESVDEILKRCYSNESYS